jgi:hypothetical protein
MGCDIHTHTEQQTSDGTYINLDFSPFDWRGYGMYGFLADVRNYSNVPPISEPRGIPDDVSSATYGDAEIWGGDAHSHSYLSIKELNEFDYDKPVEDCRVTIDGNGGCTCDRGEGQMTTYRELLGSAFFYNIEKLNELKADRVVFWFDN